MKIFAREMLDEDTKNTKVKFAMYYTSIATIMRWSYSRGDVCQNLPVNGNFDQFQFQFSVSAFCFSFQLPN